MTKWINKHKEMVSKYMVTLLIITILAVVTLLVSAPQYDVATFFAGGVHALIAMCVYELTNKYISIKGY